MKKHLIACTALSCVMATPSIAQEQSDWEAYLGAARYFWDSDRNLDDSTSLEGGLEVPLNNRFSLEAWISDFDADIESSDAELDGARYSLGGLYHLSDGDLRPFISFGGSHQEFEPDNGSDADESLLYAGLGLKKYFDSNVVLRADALVSNSLDNELTDFGLRLAVGYAFGRSSTSAAPTYASNPEPVSEVVAQPVEKAPEPEEAVVEEPIVAEPVAVETVDSDGDGIADDKDQCPETGKAFQVNAEGCPIKLVETVEINMDVKFKTNSAEVSANKTEITALADFLKRFQETTVEVEGHTDSRGAAAYNEKLSQKRADAVKAILISEYGIEANRVNATGYGEAQPIADNSTPEGRSINRRVVAKVSADYEEFQKK